jgi:hypothetical protein
MITIDPAKDLTAVGRLASQFNLDVDALLELAERLEIEPAMRIDRVVFFDRAQVTRIRAEILTSKKPESGVPKNG